MTKVQRALLSVWDKRGVVELAQRLAGRGVALLSSGGTCRQLREAGLVVTEVSDYTGFPEMLDGRVKTLHPRIHGGILGRRGIDDDAMAAHGILPIDLVVVNLYPFAATVASPECSPELAIENIDIGGPALIRGAAKNHAHVAVLVDPADYGRFAAELEDTGFVSAATRCALAAKAFAHTAAYDAAIAAWLGPRAHPGEVLPEHLVLAWQRQTALRYGENPHQRAALYGEPAAAAGSLVRAEVLQGKELSYNNLLDADAAWCCLGAFDAAPTCVIVKHNNPCGIAQADTLETAYCRAFDSDPESAFGGIIAFNREVDEATAATLIDRQFVEVVIAPGYDDAARARFAKRAAVRLLRCELDTGHGGLELRRIDGGLLVQERDRAMVRAADLKTVTRRAPSAEQLTDLLFAWRACKYAKSNAIVCARERQTLGIGCGQTSRVFAVRCALQRAADAGHELQGAAVASDAFFPFRDSIDLLAGHGIAAIIQPGGSIRDPEVIAAADEHGIAMVYTGVRHFRH